MVSFLDKMSPDVAEPRLTWLTLQQRELDVLSRCWLLLEALFWREVWFVHRAISSRSAENESLLPTGFLDRD